MAVPHPVLKFTWRLAVFFLLVGITWVAMVFATRHFLPAYLDSAGQVIWVKRGWAKHGIPESRELAVNVLAMGDSRVLHSFDPSTFESALKMPRVRSFNMALPASQMPTHVAMLREYLRANPKPDWILIALNPIRAVAASLSDLAVYRPVGITSPEEAAGLLREPFGWSAISGLVTPLSHFRNAGMRFVSDVVTLQYWRKPRGPQLEQFAKDLYRQRGFFPLETADPAALPVVDGPPRPAPNPDFLKDPYIVEFCELTARAGIRVMVIQCPTIKGLYRDAEKPSGRLRKLCASYPNVCYATNGWRVKPYDIALFHDNAHVIRKGALMFSAELAAEFREVLGRPAGSQPAKKARKTD